MKAIAREEAENLFEILELKKSKLIQNKKEISVQFEFLDRTILLMKYNRITLIKTYYIDKN